MEPEERGETEAESVLSLPFPQAPHWPLRLSEESKHLSITTWGYHQEQGSRTGPGPFLDVFPPLHCPLCPLCVGGGRQSSGFLAGPVGRQWCKFLGMEHQGEVDQGTDQGGWAGRWGMLG